MLLLTAFVWRHFYVTTPNNWQRTAMAWRFSLCEARFLPKTFSAFVTVITSPSHFLWTTVKINLNDRRSDNFNFSRDIPNHNKITTSITFCNLPYVARNKNYLMNVVKPNEFVYTLLTAICRREPSGSCNAYTMTVKRDIDSCTITMW